MKEYFNRFGYTIVCFFSHLNVADDTRSHASIIIFCVTIPDTYVGTNNNYNI